MNNGNHHELVVFGLSHHTAPLAMRERFSLTPEKMDAVYQQLSRKVGIEEVLVLATCNRLEFYGVGEPDKLAVALPDILAAETGQGRAAIQEVSYFKRKADSVEHLFRVASGLDSQIVGETEIFGQVKQAYRDSLERSLTGKVLNTVFQKSFHQGKWARSQTSIGRGNVSVSTVAVDLASRIFGDLTECSLLVVGTGEVSESALKVFISEGCQDIHFCGRNAERMQEFESEFQTEGYPLEQLENILGNFDIVLTSTASQEVIVHLYMVDKALKRRSRPLFFIDVAVPRDVNPVCGIRNQVFIYNMDDLAGVANENLESRRREMDRCGAQLRKSATELWQTLGAQVG
ncbi:MAG: glutamyl-tRNA reductase [Verrucomicrobiota bacterium]